MMSAQSTANQLYQPPHPIEDEYGDTASSTNDSDPDPTFSCHDKLEPLFKKMEYKADALNDEVAIVIEESFASLDSNIDLPDFDGEDVEEMQRSATDATDDAASGENSAGYNIQQSDSDGNVDAQQQLQQQQHIAKNSTLSSHEMLSELHHIESKIKAAIDSNQRIRCKSGELELVLKKVHHGRGEGQVAEVKSEEALLKSAVDAAPDIEAPSTDDTPEKQIASLTEQIAQLNKSKLRAEKSNKKTISKLRKQLAESNQLVRRLQSKKLADMENNFISSVNFLEAKMSQEINEGNDDYEKRLTALREERDTARELNLPLFNDLKKLYETKSELEKKVEGLLQSEKELIQKEKAASDNAARLSNEVLFAHEEISRLNSEMTSIAEEKEMQITELNARLEETVKSNNLRKDDESQNLSTYCNNIIREQECANTTILQLRKENALLKETNARLESENASRREENALLKNEEEDLRWKLEALRATTDVQLREWEETVLQLKSMDRSTI